MNPCLDRITKTEILSCPIPLFGSPWGFECSPGSGVSRDLFPWPLCHSLPTHTQPCRSCSPYHPSSWTWPCAYQLLKLDVNDQIYSNIFKCHWPNIFKFQTQAPAQVPVFCITPMQCQVAVEQLFFSSCSFLKFHSGSGVKWRLPFSVYKLAKNCWVATFIKFPFSLHWLRAFLTLKMFFSLITCKLWS